MRETVEAARYLAARRAALAPRAARAGLPGGRRRPVPGVRWPRCCKVAAPADWLGLGGWCVLGRWRRRWAPRLLGDAARLPAPDRPAPACGASTCSACSGPRRWGACCGWPTGTAWPSARTAAPRCWRPPGPTPRRPACGRRRAGATWPGGAGAWPPCGGAPTTGRRRGRRGKLALVLCSIGTRAPRGAMRTPMANALAVGHAEQRPRRPTVPVGEIAGHDSHLGRGCTDARQAHRGAHG